MNPPLTLKGLPAIVTFFAKFSLNLFREKMRKNKAKITHKKENFAKNTVHFKDSLL